MIFLFLDEFFLLFMISNILWRGISVFPCTISVVAFPFRFPLTSCHFCSILVSFLCSWCVDLWSSLLEACLLEALGKFLAISPIPLHSKHWFRRPMYDTCWSRSNLPRAGKYMKLKSSLIPGTNILNWFRQYILCNAYILYSININKKPNRLIQFNRLNGSMVPSRLSRTATGLAQTEPNRNWLTSLKLEPNRTELPNR